MAQYYLAGEGGKHRGPFSVTRLIEQGVTVDTQVWSPGMTVWQPAGRITEIAVALAAQVKANPTVVTYGAPQGSFQQQYNPGKPGLSIASMVLGIVSAALFCVWPVSVPCAILAIIFGAITIKQPGAKNFATTGIACGIAALAVLCLLAIFWFSFVFSAMRRY